MILEPLRAWRAKRAGAWITVSGDLPDGSRKKVAGVTSVEVTPAGRVVATDKDGNTMELLVAPAVGVSDVVPSLAPGGRVEGVGGLGGHPILGREG